MPTFHSYLKKVYHDISKEVVRSWISHGGSDRGILRRLDYAYGFSRANGNPMHVLQGDVNANGLIPILERHRFPNQEVDYVIQEITSYCQRIKELHYSFLVANYESFHSETIEFLNNVYAQMNDPSSGLTCLIDSNDVMYRMRKMGKQAVPNNHRIDFFHVPFTKRYLMGTYRYSIPGYPSLYGSSSVYGAWEEMGRGDVTDYGYIALKPVNPPIQLLDLRWRFDEVLENNETLLKNYILRLPVIIACSMQVRNSPEKFVPEYIFSQQIFQWLMSRLKRDMAARNRTTLGVTYISAKKKIWEALCNEETTMKDMVNYALLAYISPEDITQYSKTLASRLSVQVPVWLGDHVSAKKSPHQLLSEIQTQLTTTHHTYWKKMTRYI